MKTDALLNDYRAMWGSMLLRAEWKSACAKAVSAIRVNKPRYEAVSRRLGGSVPWQWIGAIHQMESGGDFAKHLHNGDPLSARTRNVPAGRPLAGKPPFPWEISAVDALGMKDLECVSPWTIEEMLFQAERYNGWGYRKHHPGVKSPYLWSGTPHYSAGKYVADGRWSSSAVSKQIGVAPILAAFFKTS